MFIILWVSAVSKATLALDLFMGHDYDYDYDWYNLQLLQQQKPNIINGRALLWQCVLSLS